MQYFQLLLRYAQILRSGVWAPAGGYRSILLFYAIPGKTASRFAWENRFALFLELL
ncbi:hypothetical protein [Rhizobium leguminosarum]|uniref:hypothetical protein n=1 Tax=Rhizobium leguminosarum TaxID=384 RepID=UPI003F97E417